MNSLKKILFGRKESNLEKILRQKKDFLLRCKSFFFSCLPYRGNIIGSWLDKIVYRVPYVFRASFNKMPFWRYNSWYYRIENLQHYQRTKFIWVIFFLSPEDFKKFKDRHYDRKFI